MSEASFNKRHEGTSVPDRSDLKTDREKKLLELKSSSFESATRTDGKHAKIHVGLDCFDGLEIARSDDGFDEDHAISGREGVGDVGENLFDVLVGPVVDDVFCDVAIAFLWDVVSVEE